MVLSFDACGFRLLSASTSRRANASARLRSERLSGWNRPRVSAFREGARGRSAGKAVAAARRNVPAPVRTPILPERAIVPATRGSNHEQKGGGRLNQMNVVARAVISRH